jgi:hypothetical protein
MMMKERGRGRRGRRGDWKRKAEEDYVIIVYYTIY